MRAWVERSARSHATGVLPRLASVIRRCATCPDGMAPSLHADPHRFQLKPEVVPVFLTSRVRVYRSQCQVECSISVIASTPSPTKDRKSLAQVWNELAGNPWVAFASRKAISRGRTTCLLELPWHVSPTHRIRQRQCRAWRVRSCTLRITGGTRVLGAPEGVRTSVCDGVPPAKSGGTIARKFAIR